MHPYMLPPGFASNLDDEGRREPKSSFKDFYRDFTQKPIPLPIWLWNVIVVFIYFSLIMFMLWAGFAVLAVGLSVIFS